MWVIPNKDLRFVEFFGFEKVLGLIRLNFIRENRIQLVSQQRSRLLIFHFQSYLLILLRVLQSDNLALPNFKVLLQFFLILTFIDLIVNKTSPKSSRQFRSKQIAKYQIPAVMPKQFPLLNLVNSYLSSPLVMLHALQPDRISSQYQQSYTKYHEEKLAEKISETQLHDLLKHSQQLKKQLTKHQNFIKSQESAYQQKILLLKIQIQRLRAIMKQQGQILEKNKSEWNRIESIYALKLEKTKIQLSTMIQNQIATKSAESSSAIEQYRKIFIDKISALTQSYQKQLKLKEEEITFIKQKFSQQEIYQLKQATLNNKIGQLTVQNQKLQSQVFYLKKQIDEKKVTNSIVNGKPRVSYEEMNKNKNFLQDRSNISNQIKFLKQQNKQLQRLNKELALQLQKNQKQVYYKLQKQINRLQNQLNKKQEELQKNKYKYNKLEQELNQFKNRKTTRNQNQNQKQEEIQRYQTEQRITYQQSIKKIYQLQQKIDPLNAELSRTRIQLERMQLELYRKQDQVDKKQEKNNANQKQLYLMKKSLLQKDQTIKLLTQDKDKQASKLSTAYPNRGSDFSQLQQKKKEIIQKDQIINELKKQLQFKTDQLIKLGNQHSRLSKDYQKFKRQKQVQQKQSQLQELLNNRLKHKQNQLRQRQNYLKQKENQLSLKEKQIQNKDFKIKSKELETNQKSAELKIKEIQIKNKNQQLKRLDELIDQLQKQIKAANDEKLQQKYEIQKITQQLIDCTEQLNQHRQLAEQNNQLFTKKDVQIVQLRQQIACLTKPINQPFGQSIKNNINDPFAESFIDVNQTINDNFVQDKQFNIQSFDKESKQKKYDQKIAELECFVQQLQFQWAQTQKNQNAIFTYMKQSYLDEISLLISKNRYIQSQNKGLQEIIEQMAKKKQPK